MVVASTRASIAIVATSYMYAVCYASCFPSLSPFLDHLEQQQTGDLPRNGTSALLGVAVAAFSGAKVVTAPLAGHVVSRLGVQTALAISSLLLVFGNVLYACATDVHLVVGARAILGVASCSSTACRAWVSAQGGGSAARAKLTAAVSSATTLGFVTGPLAGGLLFLFGRDHLHEDVSLRGPGWLGVLLGVINFFWVLATSEFRPSLRRDPEMSRALTLGDSDAAATAATSTAPPPDPPRSPRVPPPTQSLPTSGASGTRERNDQAAAAAASALPRGALWSLCAVQLLSTSPLASFETLLTPFLQAAFDFSSFSIGLVFAASSAGTLLVSGAMPCMLRHKKASPAILLHISCLWMGVACMGLILPNPIAFVAMQVAFFSGYAASQVSLYTAFNERFRSDPRVAVYVGYISAAGSLGRCVGPLWANAWYNAKYRNGEMPSSGDGGAAAAMAAAAPVWLFNGGGVLVGGVWVLAAWQQLRPPRASVAAPSPARAERTVRAIRTLIAVFAVGSSYVLASTFSSPQVLIANRPPFTYESPTLHGGGFCYRPPCDAFPGTFKPPLWRNPTNVVGGASTMNRVTAFYSYLLALLTGALLLQIAPPWLEAAARRRITIWRSSVYSCPGELLFGLATLGLLGWWVQDVLRMTAWTPLHTPKEATADLKSTGAAIGHLLNLLLGLALLPVGKRSSLSAAFGLSWDRTLGYHKILGGLTIALILCHVLAELGRWAVEGTLAQNVLHYASTNWGKAIWPWAVSLMEALAMPVAFAGLAAIAPIRRRYYYVFYRLHLVLPLFVVASLAHSWNSWQYALAGLELYVLDKIELAALLSYELCYSARPARLLSARALGAEVVRLRLWVPGACVMPGQVVYLQVPALSWVQWHPFTASECGGSEAVPAPTGPARETDCEAAGAATLPPPIAPVGGQLLVHHIKASAAKSSWTRKLHRLVSTPSQTSATEAGAFQVRAIGPFGGVQDYAEGASGLSLLVAGGVGITPISALAATATQVVHQGHHRALRLVWVARELQLFLEFAPLLERLAAAPNIDAHVRLYLTGATADTGDSAEAEMGIRIAGFTIHRERPNLTTLVGTALRELVDADPQTATTSGVSAFCCGPAPVEALVRAECDSFQGTAVAFTSLNFAL